jgi:hypothetical protein
MAVKQVMKWTLDKFPDVKRTRLYHSFMRMRERRIARVRPELTPHKAELETLLRDGVVILPGFATKAQTDAILAELEEPFRRLQEGTYDGKSSVAEERVYFRIYDADKVAPSSACFYESTLVDSIGKAFLSERAESVRREAELRGDVGRRANADFFHFDSWGASFKAFLYLTEVGPGNAPFAYVKGSQRPAPWRVWKEIEFAAAQHDGSFGHFFPWEFQAVQRRHHYEEVEITGPAGTLILGDFRGLHRGTTLREGRRILLNNCYQVRDWPIL